MAKLVPKAPYKVPAQNSLKNSYRQKPASKCSKTYRMKMLSKIPLRKHYQKKSVSESSSNENRLELLPKTPFEIEIYKRPYRNARQKIIIRKCCSKHCYFSARSWILKANRIEWCLTRAFGEPWFFSLTEYIRHPFSKNLRCGRRPKGQSSDTVRRQLSEWNRCRRGINKTIPLPMVSNAFRTGLSKRFVLKISITYEVLREAFQLLRAEICIKLDQQI